jgi:hypothetical protein
LFRAATHIPILVWSRLRDEDAARLALQRGAQDYLLAEHLDDYSLPKALTSMLERSTYADSLFMEKECAQVTLNSIGDGVISTDVAGHITYLNPVSSRAVAMANRGSRAAARQKAWALLASSLVTGPYISVQQALVGMKFAPTLWLWRPRDDPPAASDHSPVKAIVAPDLGHRVDHSVGYS